MTQSDKLPINFTISSAAQREIEIVRKAFDEHSPADPAAVLMVGWGIFHLNSGERFENVVISFYGQSQLPDVAHGIQEVSGLKAVFFTIPEYHARFEGKVIDHSAARGFFLRPA